MLLTPHILVGAAIATATPHPVLGLVLAFLSHFLLDRIPHWEYSIEPLKEIKKRGVRTCMPIIRRVAVDIALGYLVIFIASAIKGDGGFFASAFFGGFFGILPDGLLGLAFLKESRGVASFLLKHLRLFHQKIHFDKKGGLPPLRIGLSTQAVAILLALYFLIF